MFLREHESAKQRVDFVSSLACMELSFVGQKEMTSLNRKIRLRLIAASTSIKASLLQHLRTIEHFGGLDEGARSVLSSSLQLIMSRTN